MTVTLVTSTTEGSGAHGPRSESGPGNKGTEWLKWQLAAGGGGYARLAPCFYTWYYVYDFITK